MSSSLVIVIQHIQEEQLEFDRSRVASAFSSWRVAINNGIIRMRIIDLVRLINGLKRKLILADIGTNRKNLIIALKGAKYMSIQIKN